MIFISRDLSSNSVFRQMLKNKASLIDLSLIEFKPILFDRIPSSDWLFFYSKNGIKHALSKLNILDDLAPIAVIGQASADFLKANYNIEAQFVGTGHPRETAAQFLSVAKDQKVVFVQAKNSKQSVQNILQKQVKSIDLLVYDNCPKTDFDLPEANILVFTSPLNVAAYFSKYAYQQDQTIISIGQTTARALEKHGIDEIIIAKEPNEKALANCCLALISNNKN
jgi:uroporphyrinogen-III synthase